MPNYRRARVPGGTYFFTVVTNRRRPIFGDVAARSLLGDVVRECQHDWPFEIRAIVLLPDHLHAIWKLPMGDDNYSARWSWIKKEFTKRWIAAGGVAGAVSPSQSREHRLGIWQRRFWEHVIEDEGDYDLRFDYIHYNPVKHGLAICPGDWEASSFQRWVKRGVYPPNWACGHRGIVPDFRSIEDKCGEP